MWRGHQEVLLPNDTSARALGMFAEALWHWSPKSCRCHRLLRQTYSPLISTCLMTRPVCPWLCKWIPLPCFLLGLLGVVRSEHQKIRGQGRVSWEYVLPGVSPCWLCLFKSLLLISGCLVLFNSGLLKLLHSLAASDLKDKGFPLWLAQG